MASALAVEGVGVLLSETSCLKVSASAGRNPLLPLPRRKRGQSLRSSVTLLRPIRRVSTGRHTGVSVTARNDFELLARSTRHYTDLAEEYRSVSFVDRLLKAWSILFPPQAKPMSSRQIAKERLRVILAADRCSVSDDARRKIVNNIVEVLSNFVEIESEDRVQLSVSADASVGTIYSVSVPVRRVRPEHKELLWYEDIKETTFTDVVEGSEFNMINVTLDPASFYDDPPASSKSTSVQSREGQ